jgi:hypothetical protein
MTALKFVDYVTVPEIMDQSHAYMWVLADQMVNWSNWSHLSLVNTNTKKIKRVLIPKIKTNSLHAIIFHSTQYETKNTFVYVTFVKFIIRTVQLAGK